MSSKHVNKKQLGAEHRPWKGERKHEFEACKEKSLICSIVDIKCTENVNQMKVGRSISPKNCSKLGVLVPIMM
jgi:hypothetical protein